MTTNNLTLYAFETPPGFFNMSPFCVKADIILQMADLPYSVELPEDYKVFSKGKLPVLKDGDTIIQDSEFIRQHIAEKYGTALDADLDDVEKATAHALIRTLEERTIMGLIQGRWVDDEGWQVLEPLFFGELPPEERPVVGNSIRQQVVESLNSNGFGMHSREEQATLLRADMRAAATILGDKPWFFGSAPTYIDAAIFGMLVNFYAAPVPTPMKAFVEEHKTLVAYIERGLARWYPNALAMLNAG